MITPCFVNVDGTDYNIDDFILNNVADTKATVQVMNADGSWGASGVWFNEYGDLPAGWFTDSFGTTPANITLKPGQAVMFHTADEGASVQSAGQVPAIITMDVATGWSMIGNASSVSVDIDEIKLLNVADTKATVQVMNADGSWGASGVWFNEYGDLPAGWFTDSFGTTAADITLEPGQSVMFYTTDEGAQVVIPSALAD